MNIRIEVLIQSGRMMQILRMVNKRVMIMMMLINIDMRFCNQTHLAQIQMAEESVVKIEKKKEEDEIEIK